MYLKLFLLEYVERINRKTFDFETVDKEIKSLVVPIRELPEYLLTNTKLLEDILESGEILKEMTESSGVEFYLIDNQKNEVYKYPRVCDTEVYKIGPGTVMTAFVAETKTPLIVNDVSGCKEFPLGISTQAFTAFSAMCLPLITSKNDLIGLLQLTKDDGKHYRLNHLEMGMNMCNWMSSAIEQYYEKHDLAIENDLFAYFIHLINETMCSDTSFLSTLPEILTLTTHTLNAESCYYYTYKYFPAIVHMSDKVLMYCPGNEEKYERRIELSLNNKIIANEVMKENKTLNLDEAAISSNYVTVIYKPRDVTSILAVPLRVCGKTRGVIELINKLDYATFKERDIVILQNAACFCEFILSKYVLEQQKNYLFNLLAYRHDTLRYQMKTCIQTLHQMKSLSQAAHREENMQLDLPNICLDIDRMFLSVVKRWRTFEETRRHSFLLMIMKATMVMPLIDLRKIWASVQFVTTVLRTYINHFTENEKEVMMFSALCYGVNNPHIVMDDIDDPNLVKQFPDPDAESKDEFVPNECFYVIRTVFEKSKLFTFNELKLLLDQINLYGQVSHSLKTFDTKEKILELLVHGQFRPKSAKHRYWMRICIMAVAGQAMYLKPALFTANILLNMLITNRGCGFKIGSFEYGLLQFVSNKEELTTIVLMHLKMNILPWVMLLRCMLPRLKLYLRRFIEAIDDWKKLKIKDLKQYWFPERSVSGAHASDAVITFLADVGDGVSSSTIENANLYKIKRTKKDKKEEAHWNKLVKKVLKKQNRVKKGSKEEKKIRSRRNWKKKARKAKHLRRQVIEKLEILNTPKPKKAYLKREVVKNALNKKINSLPKAFSSEDLKKLIFNSKCKNKKLLSKITNAFKRDPEKTTATVGKLLENRKKNFMRDRMNELQ